VAPPLFFFCTQQTKHGGGEKEEKAWLGESAKESSFGCSMYRAMKKGEVGKKRHDICLMESMSDLAALRKLIPLNGIHWKGMPNLQTFAGFLAYCSQPTKKKKKRRKKERLKQSSIE
jgi:hypothetical protein